MAMNEQPLVSVLTPVYNGADFLAECIESVLAQTYQNYEYIIVNNCSKDRTLEIAKEYAAKDSRIKIHDNTEFVGVIDNHNLAFSLMPPEAKYCKIVSADDFIFPTCLMRMVNFAEANPSVGMVGSYSLAGSRVMWDGLEYEKKVVGGAEISRATLLGGPYVFGSPTSLIYRSDLVRKTRAFYPNKNPHSDTTACYQAMLESDFGFIHEVLSYTRVHPDTQTSQSIKFGTIKLAMLGDLMRFGPKYLSPAEFKARSAELTDSYYRVLARVYVDRSGNDEYWKKQKAGLQEIGLQLSFSKVVKTALAMGLGLLLRPGVAAEKILSIKRESGKVEARYY